MKLGSIHIIGFWGILLAATAIEGCKPGTPHTNNAPAFEKTVVLNNSSLTANYIAIRNHSEHTAEIQFSINNRIWFNAHTLIDYISGIEVDSIDGIPNGIIRAFEFVCRYTRHGQPGYIISNETTLLGWLNSSGMALCNSRSALLAGLCKSMHYEARVVHLHGHAVAEVYTGTKWIMLDADNSLILTNEHGQALSVNEIYNMGEIHNFVLCYNNIEMHQLYFLMNFGEYAGLFAPPNEIEEVPAIAGTDIGMLSLPPGASLQIPLAPNTNVHNNTCDAEILLPQGYSGILKLGFWPAAATQLIGIRGICPVPLAQNSGYSWGTYWVSTPLQSVGFCVNNALIPPAQHYTVSIAGYADPGLHVELVYENNRIGNNQISTSTVSYSAIEPYVLFFKQHPEYGNNVEINCMNDVYRFASLLYTDVTGKSLDTVAFGVKTDCFNSMLIEYHTNDSSMSAMLRHPAKLRAFTVGLLCYETWRFGEMFQ